MDCTCHGARVDAEGKMTPNAPDAVCAVHGPEIVVYGSPVPASFRYEPAKGEFDPRTGNSGSTGPRAFPETVTHIGPVVPAPPDPKTEEEWRERLAEQMAKNAELTAQLEALNAKVNRDV